MIERARDPWGPWGPAVRLVVAAAGAVVGIWLIITLQDIVLQLLLAIILATGLSPLVDRLQRIRLPRAVSVLSIYAALIVALIVLGILVVPPLIQETARVVENAPQYADILSDRLDDLQAQFPFLPPLEERLMDELRGLSEQIGEIAFRALELAGLALGALSSLLAVLFILLTALYLTVDGGRIREYFLSFLTFDRRPRVRSLTDRMGQRMGRWFLGQIVLSTAVGIITYVGLTIIGVPGAILLAFIAALGEIVPIVGPIVAAIPAIIVATIQSPMQGIITAVFYLVVQQVESYVLAPNIVGRAVKLHPLVVLLSLLVGTALFGLIGALVAVPAAAGLAVVLDEGRRERPYAVPEKSSSGPADSADSRE